MDWLLMHINLYNILLNRYNYFKSGIFYTNHSIETILLSENHSMHSVLQPSSLNDVFVNTVSVKKEATDYPSLVQYVHYDIQLTGISITRSLNSLNFD